MYWKQHMDELKILQFPSCAVFVLFESSNAECSHNIWDNKPFNWIDNLSCKSLSRYAAREFKFVKTRTV